MFQEALALSPEPQPHVILKPDRYQDKPTIEREGKQVDFCI